MTSYLSDEQMKVVTHGIGDKFQETWEPFVVDKSVDMPKPDWFLASHVDWMYGYGNSPSIRIKAAYHLTDWPNREFERRDKGLWIAESPDGRCVAHYHDGALLPGLKKEDGREVYRTTKQEGYGGRSFKLPMKDGTLVELVGPWHGSPPPGYSEVTWLVWDSKTANSKWAKERKWWAMGGTFGACIKTNLLLCLIAQEHPEISFATVRHAWGTRIEPYLDAWKMPKGFAYNEEHLRAIRKHPAGSAYRLYWGDRTPMYGIEGGPWPK